MFDKPLAAPAVPARNESIASLDADEAVLARFNKKQRLLVGTALRWLHTLLNMGLADCYEATIWHAFGGWCHMYFDDYMGGRHDVSAS